MLTVKCGCGCETKAQALDGVNAPVQYGRARQARQGWMKAAGVLLSFAGIVVHDAWARYETFDNVWGATLCAERMCFGN